MPRSLESPEGRILRYFRQAPLDAAKLLLAIAKDQLQQRAVLSRPAQPAEQGRHKASEAGGHAAPPPKKSHHKQATPASGPRKSHHKKKPTNAGTGKRQQTNDAEVESFSLPDRG